jgi:hypothetical protein
LQDACPDAAQDIPRAEVTRTDVTRAVPTNVMRERAALAFGTQETTDPAPPPSMSPPTRRASPQALQDDSPNAGDFEATTEVRPPQFTPSALVVGSGRVPPKAAPEAAADAPPPTQPLPAAPPAPLAAKPHAATLRSAAAGAPGAAPLVDAMLATLPVNERTRPMPGAPMRPVLPPVTDPQPSSPMPASSGHVQMPSAPSPPYAPPAQLAPRPGLSPRVIVLIAAGGILSLVAVGWLVSSLVGH